MAKQQQSSSELARINSGKWSKQDKRDEAARKMREYAKIVHAAKMAARQEKSLKV